jgi:hypothetical protein
VASLSLSIEMVVSYSDEARRSGDRTVFHAPNQGHVKHQQLNRWRSHRILDRADGPRSAVARRHVPRLPASSTVAQLKHSAQGRQPRPHAGPGAEGASPHAAPRLAATRWPIRARQPGDPGLAWTSVDPQHRRLHGAGAEPVQGLLAGLNTPEPKGPSLLTRRIAQPDHTRWA